MILYIISCIREDHELKLDGSFPSILLYCLKIAQCEYRQMDLYCAILILCYQKNSDCCDYISIDFY